MEDLLPWLLDSTGALDALAARAQRQREALQDAIARESWGCAAAAAAPTRDKAGGSEAVAAAPGMAAAAAAGAEVAGDRECGVPGGAITTTWTIGSAASVASLEPSASQVQEREGGGHPQPAAGAAGSPSDPPADASAPATVGELWRVHQQLAQRLDGMAADLRRAAAVASLARTLGVSGSGRRRGSSPGGQAEAGGRGRRRHWSYGQITTL